MCPYVTPYRRFFSDLAKRKYTFANLAKVKFSLCYTWASQFHNDLWKKKPTQTQSHNLLGAKQMRKTMIIETQIIRVKIITLN